ncbi:MAG TPA: prolipoprotein diacylglyceryl transferase [Bryobacteraceae bacterium]|nr:prolipoprotein diacylglyceryl transferase [Bryobacteraceae bacterium]
MYPEIFHLSFLHTYGVLVAIGFLAGLSVATRLARQAKLNSEAVFNLGFYCALAAMLGAKVMMILVDLPFYTAHPGEIFSLSTLQAGGVFYGGLIAALGLAAWYLRKSGLPGFPTADVFAPGIALGHGIGRLGCFSAGCCYGLPTHLPWAVRFTNPTSEVPPDLLNVPLHPTQLYESLAEFAIFGILLWRIRKPHSAGSIISLYLMLYSTARFIVEFFRVHEQGNLWGGPLDTSQWLSILLFLIGASYFVLAGRRREVPAPAHTR